MLDFHEITFPPYHPSIAKTGIPYELVPEVTGKSVDAMLEELVALAQESNNSVLTRLIAPNVQKNQRRALHFQKEGREGIYCEEVLLIDHFCVKRKTIDPYGLGDQGIRIDSNIVPDYFVVPDKVSFSPELMQEYQMTDEGEFRGDDKKLSCPFLFKRHNLEEFNAIFYRHIVIALNNEIVRRKYAGIRAGA